MKRIYTTLSALLFIFSIHAQVTNGGFEDWTDVPTFDHPVLTPAEFFSSNDEAFYDTGLTAVTEVAGVEGSAMRIETMDYEGELVAGFGITGTPPAGDDLVFTGGFPFTDMGVTGFTVDVRYNIGLTSPGFVIVQFLNNGVPVSGGTDDSGTYIAPLFGNQSNFTEWTYTFQDPLTQVPDECVVAFACNDVINETGFAGNFLEVDNFSFTGTSEVFPGGDFNTWEPASDDVFPDTWSTYLPPNYGFFDQSDMSYDGDHAIALNSVELPEETVQSLIYLGELGDEGLVPTASITDGAYALEFYYQYEVEQADSATVIMVVSEELNPLPEETGFLFTRLAPASEWTQGTIDFSEIMPNANYFGLIFMSGMGFDEVSIPGSTLLLDGVQFVTGDDCEFTPTIIEGDVTGCPGEDITLTTQEYDDYAWYVAEEGELEYELITTLPELEGEDAEAGASGTIYVQVTLDGCTAVSDVVSFSIADIPEPDVTIDGEVEADICEGEEVTLEVLNAEDYDSFQWSLLGFPIPGGTAATYDAQGILNLSSTFTVTVSNSDCPDYVQVSSGLIVNSHTAPNLMISQGDNVLSVESGLESYQWYLNGDAISGANSNSYEITEDGNYTVTASNEWDCMGESDEFSAVYTSILESDFSDVKIYPNPANDFVTIENVNGITNIQIHDLSGKLVLDKQNNLNGNNRLDVSDLQTGVYLVSVVNEDAIHTIRLTIK